MNPDLLKGLATKTRVSAEQAGYMELEGAKKDSDCEVVEVEGGVSSKLGCCNLFDPEDGVKLFSCGTCDKLVKLGEK
jgi:hypothetical protein